MVQASGKNEECSKATGKGVTLEPRYSGSNTVNRESRNGYFNSPRLMGRKLNVRHWLFGAICCRSTKNGSARAGRRHQVFSHSQQDGRRDEHCLGYARLANNGLEQWTSVYELSKTSFSSEVRKQVKRISGGPQRGAKRQSDEP